MFAVSSSRLKSLEQGIALWNEGNKSGAYKCFQRAVDVTPEMAHRVIQRLQRESVEYIVAPYEADAQLTYLSISGDVAAVISEDSDLLAFGCTRVLFKMDKHGNGKEICLKNLGATEELNFVNWDQSMFQQMCILSGCDYLPSIAGLGVKRAHALIHAHRHGDKAVRRLRLEGKHVIPPTYEADFARAHMTFRHQRVYDRVSKSLVHIHPLPDNFTQTYPDTDFLGPALLPEVAELIAKGVVDPDSHKPFHALAPHSAPERVSADVETTPSNKGSTNTRMPTLKRSSSCFSSSFSSALSHKPSRLKDKLVQKNTLSTYFLSTSGATKRNFQPPRPRSTSPPEASKDEVANIEPLQSDSATATSTARTRSVSAPIHTLQHQGGGSPFFSNATPPAAGASTSLSPPAVATFSSYFARRRGGTRLSARRPTPMLQANREELRVPESPSPPPAFAPEDDAAMSSPHSLAPAVDHCDETKDGSDYVCVAQLLADGSLESFKAQAQAVEESTAEIMEPSEGENDSAMVHSAGIVSLPVVFLMPHAVYMSLVQSANVPTRKSNKPLAAGKWILYVCRGLPVLTCIVISVAVLKRKAVESRYVSPGFKPLKRGRYARVECCSDANKTSWLIIECNILLLLQV